MVEQVDNFLVMHGFEANELQTIGHRGYLYTAIGLVSLTATIMTGMASFVWLT